jgi:hypothetical protein
MVHNITRAVGRLAGSEMEKATTSTLQRRVSTAPGRLVQAGDGDIYEPPASWP